jgi:sulfatase maturation enzyme AslB (radical SAM superfamily)
VDKGGRPPLDKAMRGLRLLQKHGVEYNILTTVNRVNGDYLLEVYRFLRDEAGTDWMQFPWANSQDVRNAVLVKWCELGHLTTYPTRRLLP